MNTENASSLSISFLFFFHFSSKCLLSCDSGSWGGMYAGHPSPPWEKDGQRTGEGQQSRSSQETHPAWWLPRADTQDTEQRHLYTHWYHSHTETSPLLQSLPSYSDGSPGSSANSSWTGSGWAVKRGSLVVLDLGLDVFCHVSDS